jgi:hypothetical protein
MPDSMTSKNTEPSSRGILCIDKAMTIVRLLVYAYTRI